MALGLSLEDIHDKVLQYFYVDPVRFARAVSGAMEELWLNNEMRYALNWGPSPLPRRQYAECEIGIAGAGRVDVVVFESQTRISEAYLEGKVFPNEAPAVVDPQLDDLCAQLGHRAQNRKGQEPVFGLVYLVWNAATSNRAGSGTETVIEFCDRVEAGLKQRLGSKLRLSRLNARPTLSQQKPITLGDWLPLVVPVIWMIEYIV